MPTEPPTTAGYGGSGGGYIGHVGNANTDRPAIRVGSPAELAAVDRLAANARDDEATTRPGVDSAVNRLAAAVELVDTGLGILEARLGVALGSGSPHPTAGADALPPPGDSQLVEAITRLAARVEGARQHIDNLLNRLEL